MKKFALLGLLMLAGCMSTPNPVSENNIYVIRAGYDAVVLPWLAAYVQLPRCAAGTTISVRNVCSEVAIIRKAQKADRNVELALDKAEAFVVAHPTLNASALISAATAAIATAKQIATDYAIPGR